MNTTQASPERIVVGGIRALSDALMLAIDRCLAPWGLNSFELALLDAVQQAAPDPIRLSTLAEVTGAALSRVSRAATALERRGLVEKVACPSDGRATNAVLTPDGEQVHATCMSVADAAVREVVFGRLDQTEAEQLVTLLSKLGPGRCPG